MGKNGIVFYGVKESPFGICQLAFTCSGICFLGFVPDPSMLAERLPRVAGDRRLVRDDERVAPLIDKAFSSAASELALDLRGTSFQLQVWMALRQIPFATTASYQKLAELCGRPRAVRATANAVAANRVAWLVPCHRVVRKDGGLGGYYWGSECKRRMLEYERRLSAVEVCES